VVVPDSCLPVDGSIWIILMPFQNEPKDSHQRPEASTVSAGSIAL
jgi:hypothetical protein